MSNLKIKKKEKNNNLHPPVDGKKLSCIKGAGQSPCLSDGELIVAQWHLSSLSGAGPLKINRLFHSFLSA